MKKFKDGPKSFVFTVIAVVLLALFVFIVASWLLAPRFSDTGGKNTYKPKTEYPNGPVKLTYWRVAGEKDAMTEILSEWQKVHSNIAIEVVDIPSSEYESRITSAYSKDSLPDLFMLRPDWLPRYRDNLKPSPKKIFEPKEYNKTFAPVANKDLIFNNEVYAVTYALPTIGLYYNSKVFNELGINNPPKTWQELVDINSKLVLKQGDGLLRSGVALGTAEVRNSTGIMPLLMIQNGAVMTNQPPTKATFELPDSQNYPSSAKALDFYISFALPQKSTYSWSNGFGDSLNAFADSKTMMVLGYPSDYQQIKAKSPNLEFKLAPAPQLDSSRPSNYTEYWAEAVSASTKYPEVAWDFYNFMTSYEIMSKYSRLTSQPASRLDLARDQEQDALIGPFATQVPSAQSYYKGNIADTNNAIKEMINTALSGFDAPIAVRIASEKVTNSLKKYPY